MINDDIHNDDKHNYPFCRLKLLNEKFGHYMFESTNQNLINEPKVSSQRMKKCYFGYHNVPSLPGEKSIRWFLPTYAEKEGNEGPEQHWKRLKGVGINLIYFINITVTDLKTIFFYQGVRRYCLVNYVYTSSFAPHEKLESPPLI